MLHNGAKWYNFSPPRWSFIAPPLTTNRHRLNRGGDRQANAALYRIVVVRLRYDLRTQAYMRRRTAEGMSKTEVIRCLKRYVAREVYSAIQKPNQMLDKVA